MVLGALAAAVEASHRPSCLNVKQFLVKFLHADRNILIKI